MTRQLEGIWIIDADANTLYANGTMAEILRTTSEEMVGKSSFDFLFPEDETGARKLFEGKRSGDNTPFHYRLRRRDGSAIWVDVQGTPMRSATGNFIGIVGTFSVRGHDGKGHDGKE